MCRCAGARPENAGALACATRDPCCPGLVWEAGHLPRKRQALPSPCPAQSVLAHLGPASRPRRDVPTLPPGGRHPSTGKFPYLVQGTQVVSPASALSHTGTATPELSGRIRETRTRAGSIRTLCPNKDESPGERRPAGQGCHSPGRPPLLPAIQAPGHCPACLQGWGRAGAGRPQAELRWAAGLVSGQVS